jgi:eukaryotic-like serine/threonine-protein kinase
MSAMQSPAVLGWISRFEVIAHLGSGGMGSVYRAYDPQLDRDVAIKLIGRTTGAKTVTATPDDTIQLRDTTPVGADELLTEARMMARLSHPNVVPVYEVGVADGAVFVVMELIDGCDLAKWFDTRRTTLQILDVFAQAARGLAAAHASGIVHGDFKPANVLVGNDGRVRVADFGISLLTSGPSPMVRVRAGRGTPRYMAPELWGDAMPTAQSDVFALCTTLAEALLDRTVSARLCRAIVAGLAEDPTRRCDLARLIGALERRDSGVRVTRASSRRPLLRR